MPPSEDNQFRDLLDRWEELREQGQDPSIEQLCRDTPHLAEKMRHWVRVLKTSEWMCRPAAEVADETLGESATLTAEEKDRHGTLGEYTLLEELGSGGMGRVFKAVHRKMGRTVALKLLPASLMQSPQSVERFEREIQALARLSHPNIVAIHDAGNAAGTHFYVMDLVEGDDLARLVKQHGPLTVELALDCLLQVARGLEYAHAQGIVHRDIKPSNLILDHNGTVQILDLGIARFLPVAEADADLTQTGCVLGTVDYMAPEQAMNTRRADQRADLYSLGCTLYFLLTGQPLYGGETVMERIVAHREQPLPSLEQACPAAPPWLDLVFRKMVAKRPEDRYPSVTAFFSDMDRRAANRGLGWMRTLMVFAAALVVVELLAAVMGMLSPAAKRMPSPAHQETKNPAEMHATPNETFPEQAKKERLLELPVKPTWRTTGEHPLIAGVWSIVENKGTLATIVQHDGEFVATASYQTADGTVSWRAEGKISKSGHITMSLIHTQPHPPDKWLPQSRTAVLSLDGTSLEGYAAFEGGGHKFTWKLVEPRPAE